MALTRARVVAGSPALIAQIEEVIRSVLTRGRDPAALLVEVADMRAKMAEELRARSIWEVKHWRGGLVDIEFIAQYLQLLHAHRLPGVLSTNTRGALSRLRASGVLPAGTADDLIEALDLWQAVQNRIRLNIGEAIGASDGEEAPKPLRLAVAGIAGLEYHQLADKMQAAGARVREHFRRLIDEPAAAARARITQA
jgi:glutamate-ammonia-ligase adenylyltransferase